jgi:large subunit ribosomal protein L17
LRHQRTGKKLGRDSAHRKALYANLAGALIEHGRIKTTVTKAKAVKPIAEQMITLGRRGDIHARRQAVAFLRSKDVVHKLFTEVGPRFAERPGGYLRIVKIGPRFGDAAEMVYLELLDEPVVPRQRAAAAAEPAALKAAPVTQAETEAAAEPETAEPEPGAAAETEAEADEGSKPVAEPVVGETPGAAAEGEALEPAPDAEPGAEPGDEPRA